MNLNQQNNDYHDYSKDDVYDDEWNRRMLVDAASHEPGAIQYNQTRKTTINWWNGWRKTII